MHEKELLASLIAEELEIPTPEPALVKITDDFIQSLKGADKQRIEQLNTRTVFGSKYYETYSDFPLFLKASQAKYINPETIFAFDVLIRNFDRRKIKPNLMIDGTDYICIDHEHSLEVNKPFSSYRIETDWSGFTNANSCHLFYDYLKNKKTTDFAEFKEIFRTFNTRGLENIRSTLISNNLETEELDTTLNYLESVLSQKERFYQLLNILVSQ